MNKHIKATLVVIFTLIAALLTVAIVALYPLAIAITAGASAVGWVLYLLYMAVLEACE